jgi:hypothetical protein
MNDLIRTFLLDRRDAERDPDDTFHARESWTSPRWSPIVDADEEPGGPTRLPASGPLVFLDTPELKGTTPYARMVS